MQRLSRSSILVILILGLLLGVSNGRADSQILFDGEGIDREPWGIWLMDPDGTNRSLLYWACDDTMATWSPDRESVAFVESYPYSLYRVDLLRPTYCGNDIEHPEDPALIRIADPNGGFIIPLDSPLADKGWDWLEDENYGNLRPDIQWSPGRDEIAITLETFEATGDSWVGVIAVADPSGFNENLVPIYAELDAVVDYPTWNANGSKLAFVWSPWGDTETEVIKILDRETGDVLSYPDWTPAGVGLPEGRFAWIDWAKSDPDSLLFAFGSYFPAAEWRIFKVDLAEKDPQAVDLTAGRTPSWSPDDQYIVYSYRAKKSDEIRKVHVPSGEITTLVGGRTFGDSPDWGREPMQVACSVDDECSDGNLCTADACVAGSCFHEPLTGDSCGDGGWCEDGACFEPECVVTADCDDFNECTTEECVGYACLVTNLAAGTPCTEDGDPCTTDTCNGAGTCESVFDPGISGCEPICGVVGDSCSSGEDCCSGLCHPKKKVCK